MRSGGHARLWDLADKFPTPGDNFGPQKVTNPLLIWTSYLPCMKIWPTLATCVSNTPTLRIILGHGSPLPDLGLQSIGALLCCTMY